MLFSEGFRISKSIEQKKIAPFLEKNVYSKILHTDWYIHKYA